MRILIAGGCGFVGAALGRWFKDSEPSSVVVALDSLRRRGSETAVPSLRQAGIRVAHGDVRIFSDIEDLGPFDWVVDAAAEPSVLAGVSGAQSTGRRQLIEHNLFGTANLLEAAARWGAGFVLLSTSRVYSIDHLRSIPLVIGEGRGAPAFAVDERGDCPSGCTVAGIDERFPTDAPVSLYGATKLACEALAREYAQSANIPVIIDRCGVMAGAGQFGRADQGIFSWWIHSWAARRPLSYNGFGGRGLQVRDCLHPMDLARLVERQMQVAAGGKAQVVNVSGGSRSATSLAELSAWCSDRLGAHRVAGDGDDRAYDAPWVVLDSSEAQARYEWQPERRSEAVFEEIARHAESNVDWLERCGG